MRKWNNPWKLERGLLKSQSKSSNPVSEYITIYETQSFDTLLRIVYDPSSPLRPYIPERNMEKY